MIDPALYQAYLNVWGKDFSGNPEAMRQASQIFAQMDALANAGEVQLGPDNKYYPAGQVPGSYNAVPVPGAPGSVSYIPTGNTNTGTSPVAPPAVPSTGPPLEAGGYDLLTIGFYAVLGYIGLRALGVIK